jgi:hypothetical protein
MITLSRWYGVVHFGLICLMEGAVLSAGLAPALTDSTDKVVQVTAPTSTEVGETAALSFDSPLPTPVPFATPAISRYGEIALQHIAEQKGVSPDTLLIEQEHPRSYPLLGREFMAFTILDTSDGQAFVLLVDVDSGAVEDDLSALEQANAEAHLARYGKLDLALHERLQSGDDAATLPVALWVVSDYDSIRAKLESELAGQYPEVAEALSRSVSPFDVADPAQAEELRKVWAATCITRLPMGSARSISGQSRRRPVSSQAAPSTRFLFM